MPALDPLAVRVARRYVANLAARERRAIEYQRRTHGLERVDHEDEDSTESRKIEDDDYPQ